MDDEGVLRIDHLLNQNSHLRVFSLNIVLLPRDDGSLRVKGQPHFDDGVLDILLIFQIDIENRVKQTRSCHFVEVF